MNVVILGGGIEGKAAEKYWQAQGATVVIRDQSSGSNYLDGLDEFDLIVRSPGIKPSDIKSTKPVTSVTREFMAKCPAPIIGVTGTKGKGTTSSLISEILMKAGKKVWLGGNIGVPPLEFLEGLKSEDWVVLEMSSFQLIDVTQSPTIAVMLMLAVDHLNYHANLEEYHQAKANIFRFQTEKDLAVYNALDPKTTELVKLSPAEHIPYGNPEGAYVTQDGWIMFRNHRICPVNEVGLIGRHNLENVCAAVAATWPIVQDPVPMAQAIRSFKGLPHRLELVGEVSGVRYYDDSIATVPENSIAAIRAFDEPKVIILGGADKGASYDELAQVVKEGGVTKAIVIGTTAPEITKALDHAGFRNYQTGLTTMDEIVAAAAGAASEGSVVLLSPACASFDMFASYKDRGDQFKAAVENLS